MNFAGVGWYRFCVLVFSICAASSLFAIAAFGWLLRRKKILVVNQARGVSSKDADCDTEECSYKNI
jgi:hypothetical protein